MACKYPNHGISVGWTPAPSRSGRRASTVIALLLATALTGCEPIALPKWEWWPQKPAQTAATQSAPGETATAGAAPVAAQAAAVETGRSGIVTTIFTFDILRVRAPQGVFSDSARIWNHINTDFLPAETTKLLHRNGLRAGRADAEAWPPIRAILETEQRVQTAQSRLTMNNGLPLLLELDQQPKDQILFLYRRDGTLAGAPWRSSTNVLRIDYGIPPGRSGAVLLEVAPEMRMESPQAHALRGMEQWNPPPDPQRSRVIRDLAFRAQLGPGEFLAIGPSSPTKQLPYIMGALLLCEEQEGEKFESMYFITPTATRTGN